MSSGHRNYTSTYGFVLTSEERACADAFHRYVRPGLGIDVFPDIPDKKLRNALDEFAAVDDDEAILGLVDTTAFGSAKKGVVVTVRAAHWTPISGSPVRLPFDAMPAVSVDHSFSHSGLCSEDGMYIPVYQSEPRQPLADFLNEARELLEKAWHVASSGASLGPLSVVAVREMLTLGQIEPATCLAWREGMVEWRSIGALAPFVDHDGPPPLPPASGPGGPRGEPTTG